ncbi:MAG: serpin family protein, partial [Muribaculaceae bacterium]|nr:serpin family protein [Muribaculaceae bacterium]
SNTIDILKEIGLEEVWTGKAFFSMISGNKPYFPTCFVHAAKLKVDEEGTEGAAASLGGMDYASPGDEIPQKPLEIVFNRPFIFYIQENTSGSILFIGSVKTFS